MHAYIYMRDDLIHLKKSLACQSKRPPKKLIIRQFGCQTVLLYLRFILICHMTIVDQRLLTLSNMNNLVLDFGQ